ncbi:hypothetical protein GCM10009839_85840 [Catenulispora yoronensis]|uniref:DUF2975 domain-containing protein n=1 Tax=Catenulispora yoronensis TaxID=450799 RepID=A0ABP5GZX7_9ACTN
MTTPSNAAARPRRLRNPLQPLVVIVRVTYYVALVVFLIAAINLLFARGHSFGWHRGTACLTVPDQLMPPQIHTMEWTSVTTNVHESRVCVQYANNHQAFASTLANGLGLPFFLVAFGLTSRLLTIAAKGGVYRTEVVSRVQFLGWTLLAGETAVAALRTVGSVHLYNDLVPEHFNGTFWAPFWHVNWTVLLIAVALITLARILREGVGMREDLDGTI